MATSEEIKIIIRTEMNKALKDFDKLGKTTNKTKKSFGDMKTAIFAGTAAFAGVTRFMMETVKAASDLEEATGKFNTVFSTTSKDMDASVQMLTKSYFMSTREAKEYLSSVQDLLVPMGMMPNAASKMSEEVVKLAADLGSFNNMPTAQVMASIQSALVGNFETMKAYGVVLNETVIREKGRAMGLVVGKERIDAATKAQIAYKLMMEGSSAAIGDLARTSGSYANVMKAVKAKTEDALAVIGEDLKNAITDVGMAFIGAGEDSSVLVEGLKGLVSGFANVISMAVVVSNKLKSVFSERNAKIYQKNAELGVKQQERILALYNDSADELRGLAKLGDKVAQSNLKAFEANKASVRLNLEKANSSTAATVTYINNSAKIIERMKGENQAVKKLASERKKARDADVSGNIKKNISKKLSDSRFYEAIGQNKKAEIAKVKENYARLIALAKGNAVRQEQLTKASGEKIKEIKDKYRESEKQSAAENARSIIDATENIVGQLGQLFQMSFNNQRLRNTKELNDRLATLKKRNLSEGEYEKKKNKIISDSEDEMLAEKRKNARIMKNIAISETIINTAAAAMAAFRSLASIPYVGVGLGLAAAATVTGIGAMKVALIDEAPILAQGRVPTGVPDDHQLAYIGNREAVINKESTAANRDILNQMNNNPGARVGGGATVNLIVDNLYATEDVPEQMAEAIDRALYNLGRDGNRMS